MLPADPVVDARPVRSEPDTKLESVTVEDVGESIAALTRFLALWPKAREYYQRLEEKRGNARHHAQKIVALSEIYGVEKVQRALEDAWAYQAFSCEYIANILEQRERPVTQPGALHLTRQQDLLDLDLPAPDLSLYKSEQGGVP